VKDKAGKTSKYLILGGGMVAGYAAKHLVERGLKPNQLERTEGRDDPRFASR
jgi:hypothetical protein